MKTVCQKVENIIHSMTKLVSCLLLVETDAILFTVCDGKRYRSGFHSSLLHGWNAKIDNQSSNEILDS